MCVCVYPQARQRGVLAVRSWSCVFVTMCDLITHTCVCVCLRPVADHMTSPPVMLLLIGNTEIVLISFEATKKKKKGKK